MLVSLMKWLETDLVCLQEATKFISQLFIINEEAVGLGLWLVQESIQQSFQILSCDIVWQIQLRSWRIGESFVENVQHKSTICFVSF